MTKMNSAGSNSSTIRSVTAPRSDLLGATQDAGSAPVANERGLTLVELLSVIVILGLIMTVVLKNVSERAEAAKARLNETKMQQLQQMINQFQLEYNAFPSSLQDLVREPSSVKDSGKVYVALCKADQLKDIWNFDYIYKSESDGRSYSLTSLGSDGIPGGEGAKQSVTMRP